MNPRGFEDAGEFGGHLRGERAGQFLAGDLDANNISVMADADLAEAESVQSIFALLDHAEGFARDLASVLDARRQAGGSGLVPDAQAGGAGEFADFLLGEPGLAQWRSHVMLLGSFLAGTESP